LETVKMLAADQTITRDDVTNAAPGFTRSNPVVTGINADGKPADQGEAQPKDANGGVDVPGARDIEPDGSLAGVNADGQQVGITDQEARETGLERPVGEQPETGDLSLESPEPAPGEKDAPTERTPANGQNPTENPAPTTEGHARPRDPGAPQASDGGDAGSSAEAESSEMEARPLAGADEIAALEEELQEAEGHIQKLNGYRDELDAEMRKAERHADDLRDQISTARGSGDNQSTISTYLEAQKARMRQRGETRKAIAQAGVDLAALVKAGAKAPIDQAMARKTGRGGQRPSHPKR
jgi:hypothetical protein